MRMMDFFIKILFTIVNFKIIIIFIVTDQRLTYLLVVTFTLDILYFY